ncbi:MAG: hypothetical protein AMK71_02210 [Nitrospira bacterium SG8_35_4]|nr:MAG: hypothetical protein AMK71_02210 [Nitrospira bacterium SG8_35_4]
MSFWEKIQKEMNWDKFQNEFKKNIEEGLSIIKEGGSAVSQKIEKLTDDGKKKYKVFNLNMKVQEEFAKLGGQVYDLITKKSKNPLGSKNVTAIIKRINKLEDQINRLEMKKAAKTKKKAVRRAPKKTAKKRATKKKAATAQS